MSTALIVVDVQKDFCEDGKLAVEGGNEVAFKITNYINTIGSMYEEIVFTKDWHEPWPRTNGGHFSATPDFVDSWPPHCEAGSEGATFHDSFLWIPIKYQRTWDNHVFYKGLGKPDYSGFQGHNNGRTSLGEFLNSHGVVNVDVVGIAGDYCVLQTALDGKKMGFTTNILPSLVVSVGGPEATKLAIDTLDAV